MELFYHKGSLQSNKEISLSEEETLHCTRVLRHKQGDVILITNGKGTIATTRIKEISKKRCVVSIESTKEIAPSNYYIHIALAPPKNMERTLWFVEKAIEIGIDEISFFYTTNSIRKKINLQRVEKRCVSAIKQSVKAYMPTLNEIIDFQSFLKQNQNIDEKFIAHISSNNAKPLPSLLKCIAPQKKYCALIGAEGGFTEQEIELAEQLNLKTVTLGKKRLRSETAALMACHTIHIINSLSEI